MNRYGHRVIAKIQDKPIQAFTVAWNGMLPHQQSQLSVLDMETVDLDIPIEIALFLLEKPHFSKLSQKVTAF
jgi:hypothetical protein